jgi:hypothetical protein
MKFLVHRFFPTFYPNGLLICCIIISISVIMIMVPTRWSNCSLGVDFHCGSQGDVSRQTDFLFWEHQLSCLLALSFGTILLSLGLCQKQGL